MEHGGHCPPSSPTMRLAQSCVCRGRCVSPHLPHPLQPAVLRISDFFFFLIVSGVFSSRCLKPALGAAAWVQRVRLAGWRGEDLLREGRGCTDTAWGMVMVCTPSWWAPVGVRSLSFSVPCSSTLNSSRGWRDLEELLFWTGLLSLLQIIHGNNLTGLPLGSPIFGVNRTIEGDLSRGGRGSGIYL